MDESQDRVLGLSPHQPPRVYFHEKWMDPLQPHTAPQPSLVVDYWWPKKQFYISSPTGDKHNTSMQNPSSLRVERLWVQSRTLSSYVSTYHRRLIMIEQSDTILDGLFKTPDLKRYTNLMTKALDYWATHWQCGRCIHMDQFDVWFPSKPIIWFFLWIVNLL